LEDSLLQQSKNCSSEKFDSPVDSGRVPRNSKQVEEIVSLPLALHLQIPF
jgi:hypothetical protein